MFGELASLSSKTGVEFFATGLFGVQGGIEHGGNVAREGVGQFKGVVVLGDGVFDVFNAEMRQIADTILRTSADEIGVFLARSAGGLAEDETRGSVCLMAALAEEHTSQVVLVDAVALAGAATHVHDFLDTLKEGFIDERFVVAWVDVAAIDDVAEVIGIAEHLLKF